MPEATALRPDALAGALRDAVGRLGRRLRAQRATTELSLGQWAALRTVDRHGPMTPGELAGHEKVQPPSMTRIIARLEESGFVTRTPDPTDGRQIVVAATPAGRAVLADDRRRKDVWLAQRLRALEPGEREALSAALAVLEKLSRA
jgi:DNA-binding MarR family transcriptional regulator